MMLYLATIGQFVPGPGRLPFCVVIRDKGPDKFDRYVVHYEVTQENGTRSFNDGGYYDSFSEAVADFHDRAKRAADRYEVRPLISRD